MPLRFQLLYWLRETESKMSAKEKKETTPKRKIERCACEPLPCPTTGQSHRRNPKAGLALRSLAVRSSPDCGRTLLAAGTSRRGRAAEADNKARGWAVEWSGRRPFRRRAHWLDTSPRQKVGVKVGGAWLVKLSATRSLPEPDVQIWAKGLHLQLRASSWRGSANRPQPPGSAVSQTKRSEPV